MSTAETIDRFEKSYGQKDDASSNAYKEVQKLLSEDKDGTFLKTLNSKIHDQDNANKNLADVEIVGLDKTDGDIRFKDKSGNFYDVDQDGNRKEIWGANKDGSGGRDFSTDANGDVTYNVKKGDTVWSVAETICKERSKESGKQPTASEVKAETEKLLKANPELKNPDKIIEGKTTLKVSKQDSDDINSKRSPDAQEEKIKAEKLNQIKNGREYVNQVMKELDPDNTGYVSKDALIKKADSLPAGDTRRDLLRDIAARQEEVQNSTWSGWLWDKATYITPVRAVDEFYYGDRMNRESINTYLDQQQTELSKPKVAPEKTTTQTNTALTEQNSELDEMYENTKENVVK